MKNNKSKILLAFLIIIIIVFMGRVGLEKKFCGACDREKLLCDEEVDKEPLAKAHPVNTNAVYCACCLCVKEFNMEACGDCILDNEWAYCHDGYYFLTS